MLAHHSDRRHEVQGESHGASPGVVDAHTLELRERGQEIPPEQLDDRLVIAGAEGIVRKVGIVGATDHDAPVRRGPLVVEEDALIGDPLAIPSLLSLYSQRSVLYKNHLENLIKR